MDYTTQDIFEQLDKLSEVVTARGGELQYTTQDLYEQLDRVAHTIADRIDSATENLAVTICGPTRYNLEDLHNKLD